MSSDSDLKATLLRPDSEPARRSQQTSAWTLPADLSEDTVRRVRAVALVYALAYFLAGPALVLLSEQGRRLFFSRLGFWLPSALSIGGALLVGWICSRSGFSIRAKLRAGLAFEVLGSYGIAASEYHHITAPIMSQFGPTDFGMSWVAIWVMLFTVVVPTPPRLALLTAALSLSAVPVMYSFGDNMRVAPDYFFFVLIFPYLIVLMMAYAGSRVVYGLGTAVSKAREMGSYQLVERLGKGGMGEVWRARHRMLARPAAIKLIRPEVLGAKDQATRALLLRRFEREAQATALMRSAHTMELYDFGMADDGTFYYVMELLDGFDMDELVVRFGPVPAERAIHLLRQICASLGEAHEAGLIHRDVKPANVYVCRYGREVDFIKVLDFGLVKRGGAGSNGEHSDKLTAADMTPGGTPAFMSPEQALGDGEVDARSDIYAVGCVAYWLLTGTLVFKGTTPMETIVMHVNRAPEPPSQRSTLPIPGELEELVLACLAKNPDERPQSADQLARRLASLPMAEAWTPLRAREWWDEHRPVSLAALQTALVETS
jgi:tRNA A-37 threonylcarbamoyl transferase component Bud32